MQDITILGSRRRGGLRTKRLLQRLWLCTAISFLALSAPAWADEQLHPTLVSLAASAVPPASDARSVAALFGEHDAVGQSELAAQRGRAAFTVPVALGGPQSMPQIILWDELKSQAPPAPAGQGTNRINIQGR